MSGVLKVFSPYSRLLIRGVSMHSAGDVENALASAFLLSSNRARWLTAYNRIEILEKTVTLLQDRKDRLAREASEEGGKPLADSRIEIDRGIQGVKVAIASLQQIVGKEVPMELTPSSKDRLAFTFREPIGVVAAVSAFNHPFNLIVHQVIPAVAVGCPVLIKPALATPISCLNLVNTLHEAGLPSDWCRALIIDNELAEKLVTDQRVAFFSFIGSSSVGWWLRSRLAPGARCALEHGGVAPVIVEPDADFAEAVPLLAKGGFYHAGQVCVSVQRVYVHESVVSDFADALTRVARQMKVGDPLDEYTEVGPLILEREVNRVDEWVKEASSGGGKILCGGKKVMDTCYAPTVILNPPADARVTHQEIFGPVICIYPYTDRLDAIRLANSLPYAFQAAIFTKNIDVAMDTVKRIDASAVMVNDHTAFRVDWMPFGGRRLSGIGIGGISYTMQEMTQEKLVVIRTPSL